MYTPEIHRTVQEVQLLEQLDFTLTITDEAYQSDHTSDGELRVFTKADDDVILDRKYPPSHPLKSAAGLLGLGGESDSAFPGTRLYVGVAREPPLTQDETAFQDDYSIEALEIDGVPENGVVEFDLDWNVYDAEESVSGDVEMVEREEYDISEFPSEQLPIIVRANLYRDAKRLRSVLRSDASEAGRGAHRFEGLAALVIELEHRDATESPDGPLRIDGFRLDMSRTFPQIEFAPERGASYDPETRRIEWGNDTIPAEETTTYAVIGPIDELLSMNRLTATLRGELPGRTLSGMFVADLFDESGSRLGREGETAAVDVNEKVTITAELEIDPSALRGRSQEVSTASITSNTTPHELFEEAVRICDRNSIHILERSPPGEGEPVVGRSGVFHVDDDPGELDTRREYGDEGVVYAGIEITGRFTAEAEETQVSAFDETEDRLVRRTEGGLDERGRSTIEINARSAASQLNSRFISTFESAFGGDT